MADLQFKLARLNQQDFQLAFMWRNDQETRANSFHMEVKEERSFWTEFESYFNFAELPALFATLEGREVAFLHFLPCEDPLEVSRKACLLSINIAPHERSKGLGTAILVQVQEWLKLQGYDDVVAEVKKENKISQKAFTKAGFKPLADNIKNILETGQKLNICRFLAQLTKIDFPKKPFIIAEAGSNWRMGTKWRDLSMAKTLIDVAKEAGADAVKFQVFDPESLYVASAGQSDYLAKNGLESDMQTLFQDLVLSKEVIEEIVTYCYQVGIEFMATSFSEKDFDLIDPLVSRHKIASYELGHVHLLQKAAKSAKPLILSTGCATEDEIAWSVGYYREQGGKLLTLLQCTAAYPAAPEAMNLNAIPWLKQRFQCEVGLSDHSRHPIAAPVAAAVLGAAVIEKHYTLDNKLPGPDHKFALLPHELKAMCTAVHLAAKMRGSHVKCVATEEEELRSFARRGIQALRDIAAGDILQEGKNIAILRPGKQPLGLHPLFLAQIVGKKAARNVLAGQGLQLEDIDHQATSL